MAKRSRPPGADDPSVAMNAADDEAAMGAARNIVYRSTDGLSLHLDDYGDPLSPWLPVVCLPGLTRTARDFQELAQFLSGHRHRPRRVVAFDYRGRGGSDWDTTIDHYNPLTEMTDVFDGMTALGIPRAIVVGTSRGGIIGMLMGLARPGSLAGLVLNDIGPILEPRGLARIKTYVGSTPAPDGWEDAVKILQRLHGAQFTALGDEDWQAYARMTFREENGRPVADYDPALARTLDGVEFDQPMPTLWNEFRALAAVPILAIRGENSDLLSAETLEQMAAAHQRFESVIVPGEGHAPLLRHGQLFHHISAFLTGIEGAAPPIDAVIPRAHHAYDLDLPPAASREERSPG
jgi:pimeloyl-ACP methyl ester carboxylesterase